MAGLASLSLGALSFGEAVLSADERFFIEGGVSDGVRADGRGLTDYRPWTVETGVLPLVEGSARVTAAQCEVIAGVKCKLVRTSAACGALNCSVTWAAPPVASQRRDGGADAAEAHAAYLAELLRSLALAAVSRRRLAVVPRELAWEVDVDCIVLAGESGVLDALALAAKAALSATRLYKISPFARYDEQAGKDVLDFEVDARPEMGEPFPMVDRLPLLVTAGYVRNLLLWDMSSAEEATAAAQLVVAADVSGRCRGLRRLAGGGPVELAAVEAAAAHGAVIGAELHRRLAEALERKKS